MQVSGGAAGSSRKSEMLMTVAILFSSEFTRSSSPAVLDVPATRRLRGFFLFLRRGVVHPHAGAIAQGPKHLVAAGHDLVALLQTFQHFNVAGAGNAGLDRHECGFLVANYENALQLLLVVFGRHRTGRLHGVAV